MHIVKNSEEFIAAAEQELAKKRKTAWIKKVDEFLEGTSWDRTWSQMVRSIEAALQQNDSVKTAEGGVYV